MSSRRGTSAGVTMILAAALGCVTPEVRVGPGYWSEDGTLVGVLITRWRSGPRTFDTPTSAGRTYEVRVLTLDGTVMWSGNVPRGTGLRVMRSEGYVAYWRRFDSEAIELALQPLDGSASMVFAAASTDTALLSPDGRWIAVRSIDGEPGPCDPCLLTLEVVDPRHRETTSGPLRWTAPGPRQAQRMMWIDADHVVMWSGDSAVAVRTDGVLLEGAPVPTCDDEATLTSGGLFDADGRHVSAELLGGEVVLTVHEGDRPGWPLRCWPHGGPDEW